MHFHSRECLLLSGGTWGVLSQNNSFNQGCWNRQRFLVHSGKPVGDILLNVREGCGTLEGSARAHNAVENAP